MGNASTETGVVLTRAKQGVIVRDDTGARHWCRIPGKGRLLAMPAPGDRVRFEPQTGTADGRVRELLPRDSLLERYVFGRRKQVAANMHRVIVLATLREPPVSPRLVDRMLVGAAAGGLDAIIAINKIDLCAAGEVDRYAERWEGVYPALRLSALAGTGMDELEATLRGRTSLLAGASGVGKSTILNVLIEDLALDTAAVSDATGRGVHTTTATFLYPVPGGGTVADTPGIREFYPVIEDVRELPDHFPEFRPRLARCRFHDCEHLPGSDGCAVREAAETGIIHPARYESFLAIRESLLAGPKRGRTASLNPPL
ncbi:MAG: Small ribosomal subunit biogenesis GTPase RsgA [Calditrichaeota bacterium]|nr:Small ribosomal subunit biogenesis GTPase RsgA [Calditrichota bacterium]